MTDDAMTELLDAVMEPIRRDHQHTGACAYSDRSAVYGEYDGCTGLEAIETAVRERAEAYGRAVALAELEAHARTIENLEHRSVMWDEGEGDHEMLMIGLTEIEDVNVARIAALKDAQKEAR